MAPSQRPPDAVAAATDLFPTPPGAASSAELPRAPVLSYLVGLTSPTRVRKIAAVGCLLVGLTSLGLLLLLVGLTLWQAYQEATRWGAPLTARDFLEALSNLPQYYFGYADSPAMLFNVCAKCPLYLRGFIACLLLCVALGLLVFSRGVHRGRAAPCRLSAALLLPFGALMLPIILLPAGLGLVFGLGTHPQPASLLLVLILPPGILLLLLLKDLFAYLMWIARVPAAEKPKVPFLPAARNQPPAATA
jgi:hypothetical protein